MQARVVCVGSETLLPMDKTLTSLMQRIAAERSIWRRSLSLGLIAMATGVGAAPAEGQTLHVSATAEGVGVGTREAPFASLASAEAASNPGDTIVILASPITAPPLDGGIRLKVGQRLVGEASVQGSLASSRVTNSTTRHNGDGIVMADNSEVSGLTIVGTQRAGVMIEDVTGVRVTGNDISAANQSCTAGRGWDGDGPELPMGMHGYAAIMVDYPTESGSFTITENRVHDGLCMDGIHVRAGGEAVVFGRIDDNSITRLQQGEDVISVIGMGIEAKDTARVVVTSDGNRQTFIGSQLAGPSRSNCEGLLTHQQGGEIHWRISNNYAAHFSGGSSCNAAEFLIRSGQSNAYITVIDSVFLDGQGDMLQNINLGTGEAVLTMERVRINQSQLAVEPTGEPESRGSNPEGNEAGRPRAHCLMLITQGPGGANRAVVRDSEFSNCGGDAVFMFYAPFLHATGPAREVALDISGSILVSTRGNGLRWANYGLIERGSLQLRDSIVLGAADKAAVALYQGADGSVPEVISFDLGTEASPGGNCIGQQGRIALESLGLDASAVGNFWGANFVAGQRGEAGGPSDDAIRASDAQLDVSGPLTAVPGTCGRN